MRLLPSILGVGLVLGSLSAFADETKSCNEQQQTRCSEFCTGHQGMSSCVLDETTLSGTCTCTDGTSHTKQK
ncbi:hypothetical protein BN59_02758 [Legionella massiliensis]|uniref:Uncharacterized protein n=1 Tax=Legionella massiliensis TaxID=1034943 RepID=A0A078L3D1_9GAMM|nr:hypothetical protein [Legionella massiliensis]CDZ78448.1 hypothetical protein BN59_02758 [Legionella massiliensis]CEE14186.1 hypothetical protein BN1094_02758 [Legionella massiliensis]